MVTFPPASVSRNRVRCRPSLEVSAFDEMYATFTSVLSSIQSAGNRSVGSKVAPFFTSNGGNSRYMGATVSRTFSVTVLSLPSESNKVTG